MNHLLIAAAFLFSSTVAIAAVEYGNGSVTFQVIQHELIFDHSTIESAHIIVPKNNKYIYSYGVNLKLKNKAANELSTITERNIGKKANIMINGIVISSATIQGGMGQDVSITGLTQEQAEQFIKNLRLKK